MVISTAEKRKARGRAMRNTETTESRPRFRARVGPPLEEFIRLVWPRMANEPPIEMTERMAVAKEAEKTSRNFPQTKSRRGIGLERIVSMGPRSFFPGGGAVGGYNRAGLQGKMEGVA